MSTALAFPEAERLADLEVTIARGLATFIEVGSALAEIRDSRLYRQSHSTFEDYCREKWGMGRANAYELMAAAEVVGNLSGTPDIPTSVSQARPLTKLEPEQQREAWKEAVETAPQGKVTAKHVARTVARTLSPPEEEPSTEGLPSPEDERQDALEMADAEIRSQQSLIDSLVATDKDREIVRLHGLNRQLNALAEAKNRDLAEAKKQATRQGKVLRDVREALGVERDSGILPALREASR